MRCNADVNSYLLAMTHYYHGSAELNAENLPLNETTAGLAEGLATAHKAYNVDGCVTRSNCAQVLANALQGLHSFRRSS